MKERKRNRLIGFDYSTQVIYFLTICCHNRIEHFGNIENNEMKLNQFGEIVNNQIIWLEQQYPYFKIHNFVVMPNHVHILCEILHSDDVPVGTGCVGTGRDLSLQLHKKSNPYRN